MSSFPNSSQDIELMLTRPVGSQDLVCLVLELKPLGARSLSEGSNATMILVAPSVEDNLLDASGLGSLGQYLAHHFGLLRLLHSCDPSSNLRI